MLRPIIMIGCGGAGNKIVRYARDAVERRLWEVGWNHGVPRAWQFIGIDSTPFQTSTEVPFLPISDYLDISVHISSYQELDAALQARFGPRGLRPEVFRELMGWRPNPDQVNVPLRSSLGQYRSVGRAVGLLSLQEHVRDRIRHAFNSGVIGASELVDISERLGANVMPGQPVPQPVVLIIGSMAGGTGSGIMLDIVELIRKTDVNGQFPTLIALSPDVFGEVQNDGMTANSASFMAELLNAYWDNEIPDNGLIPPLVLAHRRGPHSVYVIGRRNLDGLDLSDSRRVYQVVGDVLAAATTSPQVQQDFYNYQTVDWTNRATANAGDYGYASQHLPAVASSFGSVTISVGRNRLREYMQKLFLRSIVEHLSMGFNQVAHEVFGEEASKAMSTAEKVKQLAQRNTQQFIDDCGLQSEQLEKVFFSNELMRAQLDEVSHRIRTSLPSSEVLHSKLWIQTIHSTVQEYRNSTEEARVRNLEDQIQSWSSEVFRRVLRSINEYSAKLSFPVVLTILELTRVDVLKNASELRNSAEQHRAHMAKASYESREHLATGRGKFSISSRLIQETVVDISKSIVLEWSADLHEKLAVVVESVSTSMLQSIENSLRQSVSRLDAMAVSQVGMPPVLDSWPRNDGIVPVSFTPSPVEFSLEDYSTWPQRARELIQRSLDVSEGSWRDPIEVARTSIIQGRFVYADDDQTFLPFVSGESYGTEPTWEPGKFVSVNVDDSLEGLSKRVEAWLTRPATEVNRVLTEGLASYLMPINPITGEPINDHQQRLRTFLEKLQLALSLSRPLVEIDTALNATMHSHPTACTLSIDGFPFETGHPARQLTEQVIQGFLNTKDLVDWAFSSGDRGLVTITSFLNYPVNPSVIRSVTEPLAKTVSGITNPSQNSYLWQWRRSRTLRQFLPLSQELILSAIRGFAIARALGVMSAEIEDQNVIANHSGEVKFPKFLLTLTDRNNLLPALLESMVLAFGEIPTKGSAAFEAYGALISYGSNEGPLNQFQVGGLLRHFLETGDYDGVNIVDHRRAASVSGDDRYERAEKILEYLERNIERFEYLERTGPDTRSWRNSVGIVEPTDTLTQELLPELMRAYGQVLDAVRNWQ